MSKILHDFKIANKAYLVLVKIEDDVFTIFLKSSSDKFSLPGGLSFLEFSSYHLALNFLNVCLVRFKSILNVDIANLNLEKDNLNLERVILNNGFHSLDKDAAQENSRINSSRLEAIEEELKIYSEFLESISTIEIEKEIIPSSDCSIDTNEISHLPESNSDDLTSKVNVESVHLEELIPSNDFSTDTNEINHSPEADLDESTSKVDVEILSDVEQLDLEEIKNIQSEYFIGYAN
jgi:hypothetical protein